MILAVFFPFLFHGSQYYTHPQTGKGHNNNKKRELQPNLLMTVDAKTFNKIMAKQTSTVCQKDLTP
jgi:hypothetical protein